VSVMSALDRQQDVSAWYRATSPGRLAQCAL
jgi:hypothetical protein